MRRSMRQLVRIRDDFRCVYCGVRETQIGAELTLDHLRPRVHGGADNAENLVYCCHACNEFKGEYWQIEANLRLLNPLEDDFDLHYREQDNGVLLALIIRGENHLRVLQLNRPERIAHRLERKEIAFLREQNQRLRQQLQEAEQTTDRLEAELERNI